MQIVVKARPGTYRPLSYPVPPPPPPAHAQRERQSTPPSHTVRSKHNERSKKKKRRGRDTGRDVHLCVPRNKQNEREGTRHGKKGCGGGGRDGGHLGCGGREGKRYVGSTRLRQAETTGNKQRHHVEDDNVSDVGCVRACMYLHEWAVGSYGGGRGVFQAVRGVPKAKADASTRERRVPTHTHMRKIVAPPVCK